MFESNYDRIETRYHHMKCSVMIRFESNYDRIETFLRLKDCCSNQGLNRTMIGLKLLIASGSSPSQSTFESNYDRIETLAPTAGGGGTNKFESNYDRIETAI